MFKLSIAIGASLAAALGAAAATSLPVTPKKLVVVDKTATLGTARLKLAITDKTAGITNGPDSSAEVSGRFGIAYAGGSPAGAFTMYGWAVNKERISKFVNKSAPLGSSEVKVAKVLPGKQIKLIAKGVGSFDIVAAGPPAGSIFTGFCVANAGTDTCHCSEFTECVYKPIAGGTGAKLICTAGIGDPTCAAAVPLGTACCRVAAGWCGANMEENYGEHDVDCMSIGGTPGALGSVCDATGECVAEPGVPGPCCEIGPDECISGFAVIPDEAACDGLSGTYIPSAICGAGGKCL